MKKWKILKKNDLPHDILTGDYEFEYLYNNWWKPSTNGIIDILESVKLNKKYRYRLVSMETIIEISGNTLVANFKGIDYFCIRPDAINAPEDEIKKELDLLSKMYFTTIERKWIPFSEIEDLTDDIALLRPVICRIDRPFEAELLYAVTFTGRVASSKLNYVQSRMYRLATAKELQEHELN